MTATSAVFVFSERQFPPHLDVPRPSGGVQVVFTRTLGSLAFKDENVPDIFPSNRDPTEKINYTNLTWQQLCRGSVLAP